MARLHKGMVKPIQLSNEDWLQHIGVDSHNKQTLDPWKVDLKPLHANYRKYTSTQYLDTYLAFLHYSNIGP